ADSRVDALDPQSAEIALAGLAVAVGVLERLLDCLLGNTNGVLTAAVETLSLGKNLLVLGVGGNAPLHACHLMISLNSLPAGSQRPPPLGRKYVLTFLASGSARTIVPRASRMNLLERLIMPWRLPAAADRTLPVPVILNRFFAEDLVFILGILLSFHCASFPRLICLRPTEPDKHKKPPRHALPGGSSNARSITDQP